MAISPRRRLFAHTLDEFAEAIPVASGLLEQFAQLHRNEQAGVDGVDGIDRMYRQILRGDGLLGEREDGSER